MTTTAAIISIGDELLSGSIHDQNTSFILSHLNQQGVKISYTVVLPDDIEVISHFLKPLPKQVDWAFITGGLGPTHDDITLEAIAYTFNAPLETNAYLKEKIQTLYGDACTRDHLKMAEVPKGTELVHLPEHKIPVIKFQNIFILPGVPELMQHLFLQIKDRFIGIEDAQAELFLDTDEGIIAQDLKEVLKRISGLKIGSYPTNPSSGYRIRLHLRHQERAELNKALEMLETRVGSYLIDCQRC